jgi:CHRD domain
MVRARWMGMGLVILGTLMILIATPGPVTADETIRAKLQGFSEVPAVSTTGNGVFRGKISNGEDAIDYELTYDGIEGSILQGHIHLAQRSVNGGIILFLCATNTTTPAPAPAGTPPCPPNGGKVTGTLTASDIRPVPGQGIETGPAEFAEILRAIRNGVTYANVHSSPNHVGGEIRGQIKASDSDED